MQSNSKYSKLFAEITLSIIVKSKRPEHETFETSYGWGSFVTATRLTGLREPDLRNWMPYSNQSLWDAILVGVHTGRLIKRFDFLATHSFLISSCFLSWRKTPKFLYSVVWVYWWKWLDSWWYTFFLIAWNSSGVGFAICLRTSFLSITSHDTS